MAASPRLLVPAVDGGSEIVLDRPTAEDATAITAHCQDPDIQEWTTVPDPYASADAVEFLAAVARGWADGSMLTWAIRADGELVGLVGLDLHPLGSAEIGYWLAPSARGHGVMTAVVGTVVAHAFDPAGLALDRLVWHAFVGNWPSRRVAEKAGFTVEGAVRGEAIQRGVRRDSWVATLLRSDPLSAVSGRMTG
jgi:RimJ/RimL family protein N-acetyltransferase